MGMRLARLRASDHPLGRQKVHFAFISVSHSVGNGRCLRIAVELERVLGERVGVSRAGGRTSDSDFRQNTTDEDTIGGLTESPGLTRRLTVHVEFSREQLEFVRPGGHGG